MPVGLLPLSKGRCRSQSGAKHPNLWDRLVGAWAPRFAESSATARVAEISGPAAGLIGTPASFAAGDWKARFGNMCLLGDATAKYTSMGTNARFNLLGQITLYIWLSQAAGATKDQGIFTRFDNGNGWGFILWQFSTNASIRWGDNNASLVEWVNGSTTLSDGFPHLLCAVRDATTMRLYFDGVQKASAANGTLTTNSAPLNIGTYDARTDSTSPFAWYEAGIYSRALSPKEIEEKSRGASPFVPLDRKAWSLGLGVSAAAGDAVPQVWAQYRRRAG